MAKPDFDAFLTALDVLTEAFAKLPVEGLPLPVIVGGAAVEHYTRGSYLTGDFDLVTPHDGPVRTALLTKGFRDEDRVGHLRRGFYHPDLDFGVEIVGSRLFDGHTSRVVLLPDTANPEVAFASLEDMIADRMGQFNSTRPGDERLLDQARMLFLLAEDIDHAYLDKRIREEAPDYELDYLRTRVHDTPAP